jgi:essential nuclear protein 1
MDTKITEKLKKNTDLLLYFKPKLLKVLERASLFLKVYKSGKMPKIIKLMPSLKNFEEIIWLTRPDIWSDQAIFSVTHSFISKLDKNQMGRFFSLVLAPRFQETIFNSNRYSIHIQKTMKMSTRFPSVFFSSVFLPMCESKNCSLKEGAVLGMILSNYHFNPSSILSVLIRLLKPPVTPVKCLLMRTILCKNYIIPHRTLDLLVDFFISNRKKIFFSQFKTFFIVFLKNYSIHLSSEDKRKIIRTRGIK